MAFDDFLLFCFEWVLFITFIELVVLATYDAYGYARLSWADIRR
jgi:hypothetical protein